MSFIHGLGLGLSTAIILGPVFFTLLKNSLQNGRKAGIAVAIGIIISDILVMYICYYVAVSYLNEILNHEYTRWIAASLLFLFGLNFLFKKIKPAEIIEKASKRGLIVSFTEGFLVNFVNPFVFVIWIGFIAIGSKNYPEQSSFYLFITGILLGVFATDLLKAVLATRVRHLLNQKYLQYIYRIIAVALLAFAIRLILY